ncbi:hypothetical protein GGX14DRAFT_483690 [Mycena pura]|uniref:Thioesterase domain-containing protein n=1 Tax=Mycena pura TaxID=153505 RepID=A0AAD6Y3Q3_9AGAR|nr:hypothetical protein GGX14DRAFT_483690 [Mycena pura]
MPSVPGHLTAVARILQRPIPDAYVARIAGNAPRGVKEMAVKWLNFYHAPPKCFAGTSARRTVVTEVSLHDNPLSDTRTLTMVSEIDVTEEILDTEDKLSYPFLITVIDECVSSAVATLDYAEGGPGISGVSLSLNTVFHNPAHLGSKLRLINTTLVAGAGLQSCRCEVWDLTCRRPVATAVYAGMLPSLPRSEPARL